MKTHGIDGVIYVEVDRKAQVGQLIIVINSEDRFFKKGDIATVEKVYDDSVICADFTENENFCGDGRWAIVSRNFRVLEPLESEEVTVDQSQASEQVIEMLANLARRVNSLERQLADTQRNVERQAEELETLKHSGPGWTQIGELNELIQMAINDIVTLDERSQVLNAINKYYAEGSR